MRKTWVQCRKTGELIPAEEYWAGRQEVLSHQIITDSMSDTWHPIDGKHYDSKSAFRRVTKQHGGIEVGNERQGGRKQLNWGNRKRDIAEAWRHIRGAN